MLSCSDTHAFDLARIKRFWHSTEGGSVIAGVERVSVTNRYPVCKCVNGEELKWARKNAI